MESFNLPPKHVAIIMDGNGRWARSQKLPRIEGHRKGVHSIEAVITAARELHIPYLTLYAFSKENWARPEKEVHFLMNLLSQYLDSQLTKLKENGVRFNVIGRIEDLPQKIQDKIRRNLNETKTNQELCLTLALSYSARGEILDAAKSIAKRVQSGELSTDNITEQMFSDALSTAKMPDPDLLIRTSGEYRISNFLLWQISYAELYISKKFWPEFDENDFREAIAEYQRRDRRFGKTETAKA
jgi:undecaprenyl diphosphate synthase